RCNLYLRFRVVSLVTCATPCSCPAIAAIRVASSKASNGIMRYSLLLPCHRCNLGNFPSEEIPPAALLPALALPSLQFIWRFPSDSSCRALLPALALPSLQSCSSSTRLWCRANRQFASEGSKVLSLLCKVAQERPESACEVLRGTQ